MNWIICFAVGLIVIAMAVAAAIRFRHAHRKDKRFFTAIQILFAGVFCSAFVCLLPIDYQVHRDATGSLLKTVMSSLHREPDTPVDVYGLLIRSVRLRSAADIRVYLLLCPQPVRVGEIPDSVFYGSVHFFRAEREIPCPG